MVHSEVLAVIKAEVRKAIAETQGAAITDAVDAAVAPLADRVTALESAGAEPEETEGGHGRKKAK